MASKWGWRNVSLPFELQSEYVEMNNHLLGNYLLSPTLVAEEEEVRSCCTGSLYLGASSSSSYDFI